MHPKLIKHYRKSASVPAPSRPRFHGGVAKPKPSGCGTSCAHCQIQSTPLWRKVDSDIVCNACGIYWKTHHRVRPVKRATPTYPRVIRVYEVPPAPVPYIEYSYEELLAVSGMSILQGRVNAWMGE